MSRRNARNAYSLLEVVLASTICATALVPALALLRDGMTLCDTMDKRHRLLIYCVSKMEERMSIVAASWSTGTTSGNFAADGHPSIRYSVTQSDAPGSGGITNRLMSISVTTYCDDDADNTLDADEMRIVLTTKVGKLVTYENKASG